jgi:hypothetical protein
MLLELFDILRWTFGEALTLAMKDWVGEENVGGEPSLCFLGSNGGTGLTVASSFSSWGNDHHCGS